MFPNFAIISSVEGSGAFFYLPTKSRYLRNVRPSTRLRQNVDGGFLLGAKMYRDPAKKKEYQKKWRQENSEYIKEYKREKYQYNPEVSRDYQLKKLYGITDSDYKAILSSQGGVCAVCGLTNKNNRKFAIDHDHETGKIRGLLCVKCNAGIGNLKDDANIVRRALEYLVRHAQ